MQRYNQRLIEEMKNRQTQERGRLPKIQRSDAKTRMAMYKKSLRITAAPGTPEQEREKIKQVARRKDATHTHAHQGSWCLGVRRRVGKAGKIPRPADRSVLQNTRRFG